MAPHCSAVLTEQIACLLGPAELSLALILGDKQDGGRSVVGRREHHGSQNVLGNFTSQKAPPPLLLLTETGKEPRQRAVMAYHSPSLTRQDWSHLSRTFSLGSYDHGQPSRKWPNWSTGILLLY